MTYKARMLGAVKKIIIWSLASFCICLFLLIHAYAVYKTVQKVENYIDILNIISVSFVILIIGSIICTVFTILTYYTFYLFGEKIILDSALRITESMQLLNAVTHNEKLKCIKFYDLKIYKSDKKLSSTIENDILCKEINLFNSRLMFMFDKLNYIGSEFVCCKYSDIKEIIEYNKQQFAIEDTKILEEKDKEIIYLKKESDNKTRDIMCITEEKDKEIERLAQENRSMADQCATLESKLQTKPGRDQRIDNMQTKRATFWRVAGPLINDLLRDAHEGKPYTRDEIQAAFEHKLNTEFPGLKEEILALLQSGRQKQDLSFDLRGWAMESIRSALGEHAKKDSGPKRKN